jgi:hypothetical protein
MDAETAWSRYVVFDPTICQPRQEISAQPRITVTLAYFRLCGQPHNRKMQKGVYRVRRRQWLKGRLALDLQRDQQAVGRQATSSCLHKARARG